MGLPPPPGVGFGCGPREDDFDQGLGAQRKHQHRVDVLARTEQRRVERLDRAHFVRLRDIGTRPRKFGPQ